MAAGNVLGRAASTQDLKVETVTRGVETKGAQVTTGFSLAAEVRFKGQPGMARSLTLPGPPRLQWRP